MDIFQSVIMGIVEGFFTEFLPGLFNTLGHMIVTGRFLGNSARQYDQAYEVIQFAAIFLAVVLNYKEKFTIRKIDFLTKLLIAFLPIAYRFSFETGQSAF